MTPEISWIVYHPGDRNRIIGYVWADDRRAAQDKALTRWPGLMADHGRYGPEDVDVSPERGEEPPARKRGGVHNRCLRCSNFCYGSCWQKTGIWD